MNRTTKLRQASSGIILLAGGLAWIYMLSAVGMAAAFNPGSGEKAFLALLIITFASCFILWLAGKVRNEDPDKDYFTPKRIACIFAVSLLLFSVFQRTAKLNTSRAAPSPNPIIATNPDAYKQDVETSQSNSSEDSLTINGLINQINKLKTELPKDIGSDILWHSIGYSDNTVTLAYQNKLLGQKALLEKLTKEWWLVKLCLHLPGGQVWDAKVYGVPVNIDYYSNDGEYVKTIKCE